MPVRHARSETRGRPPFGRRGGVGRNGSTRSQNGSGSRAAAIHVDATPDEDQVSEVLLRALSGKVGSERCASKVDLPTWINMTNLVEDRGTIQDAVHVQRCASAYSASLRHSEHHDFPSADEEINASSFPRMFTTSA
jgi:hypothetical protein